MKHIHSPMLDREMKKGSAELLILSIVETPARHGYEIGKLIEARSKGALKFNCGSSKACSSMRPNDAQAATQRAVGRELYL